MSSYWLFASNLVRLQNKSGVLFMVCTEVHGMKASTHRFEANFQYFKAKLAPLASATYTLGFYMSSLSNSFGFLHLNFYFLVFYVLFGH